MASTLKTKRKGIPLSSLLRGIDLSFYASPPPPEIRREFEQRANETLEDYADRLSSLPAEVQVMLVKMLTVKDALRLCETSHYWYGLCQDELLCKYLNRHALEIEGWCDFKRYVREHGYIGGDLHSQIEKRDPFYQIFRDGGFEYEMYQHFRRNRYYFTIRYNLDANQGVVSIVGRGAPIPRGFEKKGSTYERAFRMRHPEILLSIVNDNGRSRVQTTAKHVVIDDKEASITYRNSNITKKVFFKCNLNS